MKIKSKKYARRFVISDIHGCNKTLQALVEKLKLTKNDALFFLGDYIDRGPDSSGVIKYILNLRKNNFNVFTLRGNHEHSIMIASIEYTKNEFYKYVKRILKSEDLLNKNKELKTKYINFFKQTEFFFELEDFYLVHAGFNFKKKDFLSDTSAMLEIRMWEPDITKTKNKPIIHGHQPTTFNKIKKAIKKRKARIPLDNGCVYNKQYRFYDYTKLGKLCCLNLDSMKLIYQENID